MVEKIFEHITVDPKVRFGKPVIAGTRVPVDLVVGKIAGGMTVEEVMQEYELTREQVQAALKYAAHLVAEEELKVNLMRKFLILPKIRGPFSFLQI